MIAGPPCVLEQARDLALGPSCRASRRSAVADAERRVSIAQAVAERRRHFPHRTGVAGRIRPIPWATISVTSAVSCSATARIGRSGAVEAIAGGAKAEELAHAMGNTLGASNALYAPGDLADGAGGPPQGSIKR